MMSNLEPMKQQGFFCCNAKNVTFNNVKVSGHTGIAYQVEKCEDIEFSRCSAIGNFEQPLISMDGVNQGFVKGCRISEEQKVLLELKGTGNQNIEYEGKKERLRFAEGATEDSLLRP